MARPSKPPQPVNISQMVAGILTAKNLSRLEYVQLITWCLSGESSDEDLRLINQVLDRLQSGRIQFVG